MLLEDGSTTIKYLAAALQSLLTVLLSNDEKAETHCNYRQDWLQHVITIITESSMDQGHKLVLLVCYIDHDVASFDTKIMFLQAESFFEHF